MYTHPEMVMGAMMFMAFVAFTLFILIGAIFSENQNGD